MQWLAELCVKRPVFATVLILSLTVIGADGKKSTIDVKATVRELGQQGTERVDVVCPGFTSDCLETLEEINQEAREAFLDAGGTDFRYIRCLNDLPEWITALADVTAMHMQGWPTREPQDTATLALQREAALAMGARD